MPKDLTGSGTSTIASKMSNGTGGTKKKYIAKTGADLYDEESSFNLLLFGDQGTGKTYVAVHLLLLGMRVLVLNTDFGKNGINTVKNYFKDHSEQADLYRENFRVLELDLEGFMAFCRNPSSIMEDVYTWKPDVIFWDGATAYQQGDLENQVCGGDYMHESADWQDWGKVRKGTIFPLMNLLNQHNTETGQRWNKVITTLEQEKVDRRKSASKSEKKDGDDIISGSEKKGPMLDTTARDLAGAGFDIVFQTIKKTIAGKETFKYRTAGSNVMTKQRGFNIPVDPDADFAAIFRQYIAPKIGWVESKGVGEKV